MTFTFPIENYYLLSSQANFAMTYCLEIHFSLTQVTVCCGYVACATPFRSRNDAAEHCKWIAFELMFCGGCLDDLSMWRATATFDAFPILSIDNITLAHQIEHFFEFDLQRPINL